MEDGRVDLKGSLPFIVEQLTKELALYLLPSVQWLLLGKLKIRWRV